MLSLLNILLNFLNENQKLYSLLNYTKNKKKRIPKIENHFYTPRIFTALLHFTELAMIINNITYILDPRIIR